MTATVLKFPDRHGEDGDRWEPWLTEDALARHFSVSARTVRRWRDAGMPSRLIGGSRRYKISLSEDWHERRAG